MADKSGLGRIGLMFGAATFFVMLVGAVVVTDTVNGTIKIDEGGGTSTLSPVAR